MTIGGKLGQLATATRAVTTDSDAFTALCYLGAVLNGAAGVLVMSAPPLVTAIWFSGIKKMYEIILTLSNRFPIGFLRERGYLQLVSAW